MKRAIYTIAILFACLQAFAQSYTYDNLNRLTKVSYGNGTTVTYTYDALGNRLSKVVAGATAQTFTITVAVTPTGAGTVTGGGTYTKGATIELNAVANSGYSFQKWSDGNTDNPRQVTVTQNKTYTAQFGTASTLKGDVNGDGVVDVDDLNIVINIMVRKATLARWPAADLDDNGIVDVDDLNKVINIMIRKDKPEEGESETTTYTVNGVSFKMVKVEGGTFMMGAPSDDSEANDNEKPAHSVTLSTYSIGETEVTQALWQAVMGSNPSKYSGNPQRPVEQVSWNDCQSFIAKLNKLTGQNFRLPTEAEWEFAACGGNKSKGYKYAGSNTLNDVAWNDSNACDGVGESSPDYGLHAVATKAANELGLFDMSGNVWEWCSDWFGSNFYSSSPSTNPTGPSSGSERVQRGGSWYNYPWSSRVTTRISKAPENSSFVLGLRLAR